ncbi:hypothetical protein WN943_015607 [Citrus x changshan-huyou]
MRGVYLHPPNAFDPPLSLINSVGGRWEVGSGKREAGDGEFPHGTNLTYCESARSLTILFPAKSPSLHRALYLLRSSALKELCPPIKSLTPKVIFGTDTCRQAPDYLMIVQVKLPLQDTEIGIQSLILIAIALNMLDRLALPVSRLLDYDPPPPLLLDHDPSPPHLLDHELSPMIFQVMTQVRSALDVWAPLSLPKQLARENFSLNNREKNLIL